MLPRDTGAFDHIELRIRNTITVVPPSKHKSGKTYHYLFGEPEAAPMVVTCDQLIAGLLAVAIPPGPKSEPERKPVTRTLRKITCKENLTILVLWLMRWGDRGGKRADDGPASTLMGDEARSSAHDQASTRSPSRELLTCVRQLAREAAEPGWYLQDYDEWSDAELEAEVGRLEAVLASTIDQTITINDDDNGIGWTDIERRIASITPADIERARAMVSEHQRISSRVWLMEDQIT